MKTLYRWSLILFVTRDVHECQSRLCIADRVMALRLRKLRHAEDFELTKARRENIQNSFIRYNFTKY